MQSTTCVLPRENCSTARPQALEATDDHTAPHVFGVHYSTQSDVPIGARLPLRAMPMSRPDADEDPAGGWSSVVSSLVVSAGDSSRGRDPRPRNSATTLEGDERVGRGAGQPEGDLVRQALR